MVFFEVHFTLRYTQVSCMPFRASMDFERQVQAVDEEDALRQACLCLDRDLEQVLSQVNAINVSEVIVEVRSINETAASTGDALWNPEPFEKQLEVPPHIVVKVRGASAAAGAT